jgi:hypothetical protein
VSGGGVSGSDMPSLPWAARQDVSPAEDTSLAALLAGNGLPADAGAELRPVADVLASLTARPGSDELTGLAAAQAEFRRRVAGPAQVRRSRHWRPGGLVSRLGVKVSTAAAVVVMGFGGAAAAAYANALPSSWQQFAHRTFGAPANGPGHEMRATTGADQPAAHPSSGNPAPQAHSGGPLARYGSPQHARPPLHAEPPSTRPFMVGGRPPDPAGPGRWKPLPVGTLRWPVRPEQTGPDAGMSNAGSTRGVS